MKSYNKLIGILLLLIFICSGCAGREAKSQEPAGFDPSDSEVQQEGVSGNYNPQDKEGEPDSFSQREKGTASKGKASEEKGKTSKDKNSEMTKEASADKNSEGAGKQQEEPSAPALNPDTVIYSKEKVVTTASVNIRKEPSTDSEVYQMAPKRTPFTRTADDGTWSAVQVGETEYYIASAYLQLESEVTDNGYLVVIDPGHQAHGNSEQEPIGPGASETKAKVASGTSGCVTGLNEYELTLQVSLKLQEELEARGYQVMMVRTSHDVNISNSERAAVANNAGADAFIRVHANGSDDSGQNGILTICPTASNPYMGNLYSQCRSLSECVLDGAVHATGANKQYIWETDGMSGINWCTVPVTIVEMGFMTNPTEDANMADGAYQQKLAEGMADGVEAYFGM